VPHLHQQMHQIGRNQRRNAFEHESVSIVLEMRSFESLSYRPTNGFATIGAAQGVPRGGCPALWFAR
jgi:hypothetical protein